jgi:hypothetical protein
MTPTQPRPLRDVAGVTPAVATTASRVTVRGVTTRALLAAGAALTIACGAPDSAPSVASNAATARTTGANAGLTVQARFPAARSASALDGRLLLLVSTDSTREPRFQISDGATTQLVFGTDVDGWSPDTVVTVDGAATGYPLSSLADVPPGRYWVQAVLNRYETFTRSDGHTVKLPPDKGEGQVWNRKPGNLYSTPQWITLDARGAVAQPLVLDQEIEPITPPEDTRWIKHVTIRSERLSKFWGRDMEIGANVLLPAGFDEHPDARYPLVVYHGHFPATFTGFRETPPDPNLEPDFAARFNLRGYNRIQQELAHQFYKDWTGPGFPRVILIEIRHPTPFYDDSYAVNSANQGPYGDAIMYELIPEIEKRFRGIGQGWARITYGGSTGGWEAMAVQVMYPDEFNGAFAACPDPIDFRAYTVVNLYEDENAYYPTSTWKRTPRPGNRNYLGHVSTTLEQMNQREMALGSKGRSGDQWDIWQATYSPVGADGYPKPIWDKATGVIDKQVAAYWRENYDLSHILARDWAKLGPKLHDKINVYVGDMDNYYLNNAVYLTEERLRSLSNPKWTGEITYGDRAEHCWNGDPTRSNAYSRLRYHQMYIPRILDRMRARAPAGADTLSWRY